MYNEELGREQTTGEVVVGVVLAIAVVVTVWHFMTWASE